MTAAVMRKLMEGVVLNGTGRPAQLDGYSAGGKTGTAQKIDVVTHRYSKTDYVASFVGIAPVNNPAITVAVVIDSPKGDYYGTATAAPVFRDVAQQVLEYLGVPHDTELRPQTLVAEAQGPKEPPPDNQIGDLSALFDEVNNLPPNDPLRTEVNGQQLLPTSADDSSPEVSASAAAPSAAEPAPQSHSSLDNGGPAEAANDQGTQIPGSDSGAKESAQLRMVSSRPDGGANSPSPAPGSMVIAGGGDSVAVPAFVGEPVRQAVESAGAAGLSLQVLGSGIAREQVPVAGTMVPPGTDIVVRFTR
jgi:cell division protein FtsI (penicillin-binding protein 3)